jgi:translation initiation factor IF-3
MQFRGRELSHRDLCEDQFLAILKQVTEQGGVIESQTRLMGNKIMALLNPEKKK